MESMKRFGIAVYLVLSGAAFAVSTLALLGHLK